MIGVNTNVSDRTPAALHVAGRTDSPPAWMAVGLRGLARMTDEEREITVENVEALVHTAYGNGPTVAMRGPGARDRARDVLIRLGWAEPIIFARVSPDEIIGRMRAAITAAGLDPSDPR
jgi:hypothetical protein